MREIITKITYGFKGFKEGENLDLTPLEIYKLPTWLWISILVAFGVSIIILPLIYKFIALILLLLIINNK